MSVFRHFFPLWGNISPYTYRGTPISVQLSSFSLTAKANLKYQTQVALETLSIIFTPTQLFAQCQILLEQPLVFTRSEFLPHFFISLFPIGV